MAFTGAARVIAMTLLHHRLMEGVSVAAHERLGTPFGTSSRTGGRLFAFM